MSGPGSRSGWWTVVTPSDADGRHALEAALRDWEPGLELATPPADAVLYEPDGTLYAVALLDLQTVRYNQRSVAVRRGDLLVVPQAFAIDVEPEVRLLGIRAADYAPDHFRERFLQVWGFEHREAGLGTGEEMGLRPVIAAEDVGHRIEYAVASPRADGPGLRFEAADPLLLVGLSGMPVVRGLPHDGSAGLDLPADGLLAIPAGATVEVSGPGCLGVLTWRNAISHQARRRTGRAPSPEYRPA